jgi:hypothetical protein
MLLEVQKGHLGSTWVQQMSVFQGSFGVDVQLASLCSYSEDLPFGEPEISAETAVRGQVPGFSRRWASNFWRHPVEWFWLRS